MESNRNTYTYTQEHSENAKAAEHHPTRCGERQGCIAHSRCKTRPSGAGRCCHRQKTLNSLEGRPKGQCSQKLLEPQSPSSFCQERQADAQRTCGERESGRDERELAREATRRRCCPTRRLNSLVGGRAKKPHCLWAARRTSRNTKHRRQGRVHSLHSAQSGERENTRTRRT